MAANDKQEGGSHYRDMGTLQHWDLVSRYEWDYFQAQITKYVMRWKTKHLNPEARITDLKKARHFLDKYIEIEQNKITPPAFVTGAQAVSGTRFSSVDEMAHSYLAQP
jgi:hypothetical protein